jgi:signal transduction histidine kinase
MMKSRGVIDLHESFERGVQLIFQIASYVILLGNIIELRKYGDQNSYIVYSNIPTILIIIVILVLYYFRKIHYKIGFCILIYTILANIIMGTFLPTNLLTSPVHLNFFLRDSMFIILLLTVTSFSLHKIHSLIIGVLYLVLATIFMLIVKNSFLYENFVVFFIVITAYIGLIYYLVSMFEKTLSDQHEKNLLIREHNEILNETNALLKERQQLIEEQSVELLTQKIELQRKNEELHELNATKDKFFSIIAHDIKNPFTSIIGFSELLLYNYQKWSENKKFNTIRILYESSKNLFDLLENLLQWSRSQRGLLEYDPIKVDFRDTFEGVLNIVKPNADAKGIKINFNMNDESLFLYADSRLLDIILRNLIGNAIKFSHKEGVIELKAEKRDEFVFISVIDYGIGIPAKELDKLFKIEIHNTSLGTNDEKGTGLGLILVKEFVLKLGGNIWVKSEEGKGSEFTFSVPGA